MATVCPICYHYAGLYPPRQWGYTDMRLSVCLAKLAAKQGAEMKPSPTATPQAMMVIDPPQGVPSDAASPAELGSDE
ncbi:hypothetical protein LNQ03_08295 [Klebsiella pneumoniae subsp. pneumoniae]|nr:hypothetical protein [Klebsiella pneumoniae subsp. pneumoniae]